jgi:hypothetical protein
LFPRSRPTITDTAGDAFSQIESGLAQHRHAALGPDPAIADVVPD